ncbi:flagellar export protein FliJ [Campylobacter mucosalis]|uniref:flagellar export protein FliJ n=1 Tax=Campylobacter mucosalis TaxID=202 RepID=UPI00146FF038|nr:flagellar export protein FliJ [Campylobacter mucosalis]
MPSKFTPIVRVKKQALDKIEIKLIRAKNDLSKYNFELSIAKDEINRHQMPKSGDVSELRQSLEILKIMNASLKELKEKIELTQREVAHFTYQYKNANLEYEKVKYLEEEEIKLDLKKKKRAEELMLDEFATIKFAQGLNRDI